MHSVKVAPVVTIEGLNGSYVVNGKLCNGIVELSLGKYIISGESLIRLYGNRVKVVKIPRFEVEVLWEK
jgi:hypothetical protein